MLEANMTIMSLLLLGVLIVISPGADFVLVLKNTLNGGRRAGIWTALGISLAISIHIGYSLMGIRYLMSHNSWLYSAVQYMGGGYLIYIGAKAVLFSHRQANDPTHTNKAAQPSHHYFRQGFLCNALNPKTMLFFISIFSQVVTPQGGANLMAYLYGTYMIILHALWFSLVAYTLSSQRFQHRLETMRTRLNQACGIGLFIFGVSLLFRT